MTKVSLYEYVLGIELAKKIKQIDTVLTIF